MSFHDNYLLAAGVRATHGPTIRPQPFLLSDRERVVEVAVGGRMSEETVGKLVGPGDTTLITSAASTPREGETVLLQLTVHRVAERYRVLACVATEVVVATLKETKSSLHVHEHPPVC